jgi:hypothetical protein
MELVDLTRAAQAIGVDKATISRLVAKHPQLNRGGARKLVNVGEVQAIRNGAINPAMSAAPDLGLRFNAEAAPIQPPLPQAPQADPAQLTGAKAFNEARAQREAAAAGLQELQLAERLGKLVSKEKVETAAYNAARAIRDQMLAIPGALADQLATKTDPREIRTLLRQAIQDALNSASMTTPDQFGDDAAA